jgi:hypothetical protein
MATWSDEDLHRLVVSGLRCRQYVITHTDHNGITGVDNSDSPINLTWHEAANLLVSLLTGKLIDSEVQRLTI